MAVTITLTKVKLVKESTHRYSTIAHRQIHGPADAAEVFNAVFDLANEAQEVFCALVLDAKNSILGAQEITRGTLNGSLVSPREVFKPAILHNAASIIVGHNHPSGSTEPSKEDIAATERLGKAAQILDIPLLDHIIIAGTDYRSLKEDGMVQ